MSDGSRPAPAQRLVIGMAVSADSRALSAALVRIAGHGHELKASLVESSVSPLPKECAHALGSAVAEPPGCIARMALASQLADAQTAVVEQLLTVANLPASRVLAVAVDDPGVWHLPPAGPPLYESLCDAPRLAERTGLNVVDAFAAIDLAAGGQGGPPTALASWLLLRDVRRWRVLVHLGRTFHVTWLPPGATGAAAAEVLSFDVGPGTRLLDMLARQLTSGQQTFDPGGHLAVQGRQIGELFEAWLADPYFERPLPRWHPRGVRPDRFLNSALPQALANGWSVRDMLCTATHLLAESVARAIRRHLSRLRDLDEVLLSGGGLQNGMLLRELSRRLDPLPMRRVGELDWPPAVLRPAAVAVAGALRFDQVPGSYPSLTGSHAPRVLGRLTPAPHSGWLRNLAEHSQPSPHFQTAR